MSSQRQENLAELRRLLIAHFDESELRDLCFELAIDYEDLPGQGKRSKCRELVTYVRRRGLTSKLVAECRKQRPNVEWPEIASPAPPETKEDRHVQSREMTFLIWGAIILTAGILLIIFLNNLSLFQDRVYDFLITLFIGILLISIFSYICFFFIVQLIRRSRQRKLATFFNLGDKNPTITLYLSRHQSIAKIPTLDLPDNITDANIVLAKLREVQVKENQESLEESMLDIRNFTVVSAVEMIEALRLKENIEELAFFDWFPRIIQETFHFTKKTNVSLQVCPNTDDYQKIISDGTLIFIGGPRANLGTYYYMYGEEVGKVRMGRLDSMKNTIEIVGDHKIPIECSHDRNLAIVQRSTKGDRTIIYLSGTGINGTATAIVYLRKNWSRLQEYYNDRDFCIIIECIRRRDDDIGMYTLKEWNDEDFWVIMHMS
jgi:hypothetical protein